MSHRRRARRSRDAARQTSTASGGGARVWAPGGGAEAGRREGNCDGEWREVPVLDRERMGEGSEVVGPAIVEFKESTCVVRPGWRGTVDGVGTLVLERE